MSVAIWYALAALVLNGLMDFTFKKAASGSIAGHFAMHQFIVAQSALFFTTSLVYGVVAGELKIGPQIWLGFVAGVFMFAGFNCFAWSLRYGSISVNGPIFRLNFLVTAALAIVLLGEAATPVKLFGLALALVAIWLLLGSSDPARGAASAERRRSLVLAVLATLALGAGNTIHKVGIAAGGTPATQLLAHSFVFLLLSAAVAIHTDRGLVAPRAVWPVATAGAVVGAMGFVMMMRGLKTGDASVIVPIAQMGLVVSAALGIVLLREILTPRKLAGLAMALAALAALALS